MENQQTSLNRDIMKEVVLSGGYNTKNLDDWVDYANKVGIEKAIQDYVEKNPGYKENVTNITPFLGKSPEEQLQYINSQNQIRQSALARSELEKAHLSGGYNLSNLDQWVDYANREGLEKALMDFQKANPGSKGRVNVFPGIAKRTAERTLGQIPMTTAGGPSNVIPPLDLATLYRQPNLSQQTQQVSYPTLRPQIEPQSLVAQPMNRPTLSTPTQYASGLASLGRNGDSMLVHMTPGEVAGLQSLATQMGGSLTVNPDTGLPEANFFKKILPVVAAIAAPYLAPGLAGAAIAGGLAGVGTMLGGGSFNQGLKTGLLSFGAAGLSSGAMGADPLGATTGQSTFNLGNTFGGAKTGPIDPSKGGVNVTGGDFGGLTEEQFYGDLGQLTTGEKGLQAAATQLQPAAVAKTAGGTKILGMDPSTLALLGVMGAGGAGISEQQKLFEQEQERLDKERKRRGQLGIASYERSGLRDIPMGAGGGLVAMASGGMTYMEAGGTTGPTGTPRDVTGTGDGMSDSVPATIEGVQEARLADGEFVIPADVVADIGNGSSDAGSKKLYDMMDRIREARHGTTEQPPEIDAEALMPA